MIIVNYGKWFCGVCGKGVQANSVQCTVCKNRFTNGLSGRLRWYGHVMRKGDEGWLKKCMEYRV